MEISWFNGHTMNNNDLNQAQWRFKNSTVIKLTNTNLQPRSQGLSSYRPLERAKRGALR